ncbi:glycosyltransferase [Leeuwenhoekiella marinoflava]|uniref:UDP-N-acetylglucosamine transferase subunit ALG13 n=2 Tax=Leeuwenhoekiella marinoflava TaxID=988 RepID=A0A4Q0PGL4_9FLAO|nr:glycosyltransferase [Leeuwenhoekiella marinoflava]RXG26001.1 UDP-N-acetylglucosamine transferase subunit ALG13 [Leeuwenhoekiella marinoflava]SHF75521.1 UDP-N-acetylglucosamine transferase subunit ALG13 [Leeuwenhoekiella marinoflava DSM 3653]
MIFVTTGTQEPFDRLVAFIDQWSQTIDEELIVQATVKEYQPKYIKLTPFIEPEDFNTYFSIARFIIGHAGMGTIISSLVASKVLIVVPRLVAKGEHRNEHQLATARKMNELNYVRVAFTIEELSLLLNKLLTQEAIQPLCKLQPFAENTLISSLRTDLNLN